MIRGGNPEALEKHVTGLKEVTQQLNEKAVELSGRLHAEDKKYTEEIYVFPYRTNFVEIVIED